MPYHLPLLADVGRRLGERLSTVGLALAAGPRRYAAFVPYKRRNKRWIARQRALKILEREVRAFRVAHARRKELAMAAKEADEDEAYFGDSEAEEDAAAAYTALEKAERKEVRQAHKTERHVRAVEALS